jgi:hypothetical protein
MYPETFIHYVNNYQKTHEQLNLKIKYFQSKTTFARIDIKLLNCYQVLSDEMLVKSRER